MRGSLEAADSGEEHGRGKGRYQSLRMRFSTFSRYGEEGDTLM